MSDEQLGIIEDFKAAKDHFELMKKKYELLVVEPLKESARLIPFEDGAKSATITLSTGDKLVYMRPTLMWQRKRKYTTEYLVAQLPDAFEQRERKDSLKLIRNA